MRNRWHGIDIFQLLRLALIIFVFFTMVFHLIFTPYELPRKTQKYLGAFLYIPVFSAAAWVVLSRLNPFTRYKAADFILFQLALGLVLLEIVVGFWSYWSTSPLALETQNVKKNLRMNRFKPGEKLYGFPINSLGFYDREFAPGGPGRFVINAIADSFGIPPVPYDRNFLTIAETILQSQLGDVEVHVNNFSVPSIGMPEYVELHRSEAAAYDPDLTVLCIFVGNDIEHLRKDRVETIWNFSHWRIHKLWIKWKTLRAAPMAAPRLLKFGKESEVFMKDDDAGFNEDSPSIERERFLDIERNRLKETCSSSARGEESYKNFFIWLEHFHKVAGQRLVVLLIPDEFQVNDQLYSELGHVEGADRFQPQRRILQFCKQEKLDCLDLLPVLREGEKTGRCYHPQDTHWNTKGNRLAGEALATKIMQLARTTR